MEEKRNSRLRKFFLILVILFIVFLISWFLFWGILKFTFIFKVFDYVVQNIINVSGMSRWLAKGLVTILIIPFFWALQEIFKLRFKLHFTKPKKSYRKLAIFVVISYIALFFLSMFFLSRGTYFGHTTGEVMKWYAETPEGIRFFDSPGYDPKYGIKLKPVTPELMENYQKKMTGLQPKRVKIKSIENFEFFDPITGEPKVWYYKNKENQYEFFDRPGFHPVYNVELKPVIPEVVQDYQRSVKEELEKKKALQWEKFRNRFVNTSFINFPQTKEVSILIVNEKLKEQNDIENTVASIVRTMGLKPVLSFFKETFIKEGVFDKLFSGDIQKVKDLQLENHTDYIILAKESTKFTSSSKFKNIITSNVKIEIKIISAEKRTIVDSTILSAKGSGFSNADAEANAFKDLKGEIEDFLKKTLK